MLIFKSIILLFIFSQCINAQDSIRTFIKDRDAYLYYRPERDAHDKTKIHAYSNIIIVGKDGDFYKLSRGGYILKHFAILNTVLKLYNQGFNKFQRDSIIYHRANSEEKRREKEIDKKREYILKKYGQKDGDRILEHVIWIGMTKEMAADSWGKPDDIHRTVTMSTVREQWIYGEKYLYFEDGILTTYQD